MGVATEARKLAAQLDRVGAAVGDVEAQALRGDEGVRRCWATGAGMKGLSAPGAFFIASDLWGTLLYATDMWASLVTVSNGVRIILLPIP
jgi:hypothetical protein